MRKPEGKSKRNTKQIKYLQVKLFNNYKEGVPLDLLVNNHNTKLELDSITDEALEDDDLARKILLKNDPNIDIDNIVDVTKAAKKVLPRLKENAVKEVARDVDRMI